MKTRVRRLPRALGLLAGVVWMPVGPVTAQTLTVLHAFTGIPIGVAAKTNADGAYPQAGLILSGNTLYGTARIGGNFGAGTVFSLSFAPQLAIALSETNVVLSWPADYAGFNYSGFALQSTTNLAPPAVWSFVSRTAVEVNGENFVTNSISGTAQFFRLSP
jgi:uncharacterized repeat protein (TIGR03803 family)